MLNVQSLTNSKWPDYFFIDNLKFEAFENVEIIYDVLQGQTQDLKLLCVIHRTRSKDYIFTLHDYIINQKTKQTKNNKQTNKKHVD